MFSLCGLVKRYHAAFMSHRFPFESETRNFFHVVPWWGTGCNASTVRIRLAPAGRHMPRENCVT